MDEELEVCYECGNEFEHDDVTYFFYPRMLENESVGQCRCKKCFAYLSELFLE